MNNSDDDRDVEYEDEESKDEEDELRSEDEKSEDEESQHEDMGRKENESATPEPIEYPEVTISAFTETGREESSIVVPLQRAYTGRKPVIPSRLADTPCATLGVDGLMDELNTTLGTHKLRNPFLSSILEECITNGYNFGRTYSCLRQVWHTANWSTIRDGFWIRQEEDWKERREALDGNRIVETYLRPRRVWDLYSNRVVPRWLMPIDSDYEYCPTPMPISHAWMDEEDRTAVWTPINGHEWPVPIPKDADLNLIRIEMLNLGAEYAWLDILCLRQEGGSREDLRAEEWMLDVPTIGGVYQDQEVVCYLSGLGRPLTLTEGDLDNDRSWFRRAWTLQEVGTGRVIAGDTPDGPLHAKCKDGKYETKLLTRFHEQLPSAFSLPRTGDALVEMRTRVSTNAVDKIAGLAFMMESQWIPAYYESASLEDAWTALVHSMNAWRRAELFILCAEPGDGGPKWRPSWDQAMTKPLLPYLISIEHAVDRDETWDEDTCCARCVEGVVRGLAVVEGRGRHGEFIVECDDGIQRFEITAAHTYPIPEDTYTLVFYSCDDPPHPCIVGRSLPDGRFEKVSVVETYDKNLRGITEGRCYILI
ncbi:hypothetical protein EDD18DRAFT_778005 [Armillaria luteobubalina]|uniref:Heterokaryon incompatibility domain-containing protein n=1 Tax=Armillaria luteobubalina TaxID=153913 RepID=A0AA39QD62_9AGAR|nr:hypothetical protein EDD18DRAFT_778005 [Armillaria luteobubalina]